MNGLPGFAAVAKPVGLADLIQLFAVEKGLISLEQTVHAVSDTNSSFHGRQRLVKPDRFFL